MRSLSKNCLQYGFFRPLVPLWTPARRDGAAALTFDDGPDPERTPRILDLLARHAIEASPSSWLASAYAAIRTCLLRVVAEGHAVASHTDTHQVMTEINSETLTRRTRRVSQDHRRRHGRRYDSRAAAQRSY